MSDLLDLGDMHVPEAGAGRDTVNDTFSDPVACKLGFIGLGQGGSRQAEAFAKLGYGRVCVVNSTHQDLDGIQLPAECKLDLGTNGAGGDPAKGREAIAGRQEDVFALLKRSWGTDVDRAFICFAGGGGTGAGTFPTVVDVVKQYATEHGRDIKVGVILILPKDSEGMRSAKNACDAVRELARIPALSPIVLVDNQRIEALYPGMAIARFYGTANTTTAQLMHLFNRLAAKSSDMVTFDPADLGVLLDSGLLVMGAQPIKPAPGKAIDEAAVSTAIRQQLKATVLADVDLTTGTHAGLVFVVGQALLDTLPQRVLDHGHETLSRMLPGVSLFRGIYPTGGDSVQAFTMIGGLKWPRTRIDSMARRAGLSPDAITTLLP